MSHHTRSEGEPLPAAPDVVVLAQERISSAYQRVAKVMPSKRLFSTRQSEALRLGLTIGALLTRLRGVEDQMQADPQKIERAVREVEEFTRQQNE